MLIGVISRPYRRLWGPTMQGKRRGLTLIEVLIFTALGLMIGRVAVGLYTRGVTVSDETTRAISVQKDVRAIVELIRSDINRAFLFGDQGDPARQIHLVLYAFVEEDTATNRLALNSSRRDYPFWRADSAVENKVKCERIQYKYDMAAQKVERLNQKGELVFKADDTKRHLATSFTFTGEGDEKSKAIGTNIKSFDLRYFGYERSRDHGPGILKVVTDLQHLDGYSDEFKVSMTSCVLLRVRAAFLEGVYARSDHNAPDTEILTKMWSNTKLRDEIYHEYFSTLDWDMRF